MMTSTVANWLSMPRNNNIVKKITLHTYKIKLINIGKQSFFGGCVCLSVLLYGSYLIGSLLGFITSHLGSICGYFSKITYYNN